MSFRNKKKVKKISDPGIDSKAEDKIYERVKNSMLSCADSFNLSNELGISKKDIGMFADCHEIRLIDCQLGLFGKGPGRKKQIKKLDTIPDDLKQTIAAYLKEGRLSCRDAWEIASKLNIKKTEVSNACESMKIKIVNCRIGAF